MTKTDILEAIRETAAKNAGIPLGQRRFTNETGIQVHTWRGKFWIRWSEAVAEAGFAPNSPEESISQDFVLKKLAELTRKIRHFPTYAEMLFAKRTDDSFPGVDAVHRLGSKFDRISLLRGFASSWPEFADVVDLLPSSPLPEDEDTPRRPTGDEDVEGFVYMMRLGKHYKIGHTTAVPRRHRQISLELPQAPSVVHYIRTDDPAGIEHYWHGRFDALRVNGEWFSLTQKEVRAFKRRKMM